MLFFFFPFPRFPTIILGTEGLVLVFLSGWLIRFNFMLSSLPSCPGPWWLITHLQSPNKWSQYLLFIFGSFPQPKLIEPLHRQQFRNSWPGFLLLTAALDMAGCLVDWTLGGIMPAQELSGYLNQEAAQGGDKYRWAASRTAPGGAVSSGSPLVPALKH